MKINDDEEPLRWIGWYQVNCHVSADNAQHCEMLWTGFNPILKPCLPITRHY
jgi:hypothetical protein